MYLLALNEENNAVVERMYEDFFAEGKAFTSTEIEEKYHIDFISALRIVCALEDADSIEFGDFGTCTVTLSSGKTVQRKRTMRLKMPGTQQQKQTFLERTASFLNTKLQALQRFFSKNQ